jgi:hypothetical protein
MGAAIFSAIEYSKEKSTIDDLKAKRQEFLQKYKACINGKCSSYSVFCSFGHENWKE